LAKTEHPVGVELGRPMPEEELIEVFVALVLGVFCYFVPMSSHRPHSGRVRVLIVLVPLLFLGADVASFVQTGRGVLYNAVCMFFPSGKGCRNVSAEPGTQTQPTNSDTSVASDQPAVAGSAASPAMSASSPHAHAETSAATGAAQPVRTVRLSEDNSKDIWSTSVYSYAPGGGGPGGGKENDYLRVGGYGDQYVTLIQFSLSKENCAKSVSLQLYNSADGASPTPMYLYVITAPWSWAHGDRLWWRDLPASRPWNNRLIPAPDINAWLSIDLTDIAKAWCTGDLPNYGVMLRPVQNNNNYDHFASTRAADESLRPRLVIGT